MRQLLRGATALVLTAAALVAGTPASHADPVPVHPRLLFSAGEVPALRQRVVTEPIPRAAYARLLEKAEGYLVSVSPDLVRQSTVVSAPGVPRLTVPYGLQNEMPTYLIELGMAYQLSGDARYGRRAIDLLLALGDAHFPRWCCDDLGIGDLDEGLGLAFDWTYQLMTPAERTRFVTAVNASQDELLVRPLVEYTNLASEFENSNWMGVTGGGAGLLLLALQGEPAALTGYDSAPNDPIPALGVPGFPARHYSYDDYLAQAERKVSTYFTHGFDALGAGAEGFTYAHYGLKNSVPFALAARRAGLGDLIAGTGLPNVPRWMAFEQLPGEGQNFIALNDSQRAQFGVDLQELAFGIAPDSGVAQWVWQRTAGPLGSDYFNQVHPPGQVAQDDCTVDRPLDAPLGTASCNAFHTHGNVWAILFHRSTAQTPEVDPATTSPLTVHYTSSGLVDARTGFRTGLGEVVSTFQARRNGIGHYHYDLGSFTLYGDGGRWGIDPGYSCAACGDSNEAAYATAHNVIVIDGKKDTQYVYSRYFGGTTIDRFVTAPTVSLAHADLRYAYNFESPYAGRDHLFSRAPGRPVIVALADQVQRDGSNPHTYSWQMLSDKRNVITTDGSAFTAKAPGGATLVGRAAADGSPAAAPAFSLRAMPLTNSTDDISAAPVLSTTSPSQTRLDQLTVLALTPAGSPAATTASLPVTGGNAVAVTYAGVTDVVVRRLAQATDVTGSVQTNASIAKYTEGAGDTVIRAGTQLSAGGRDYVAVTGSSATVVVSGPTAQATGAAGNTYRVFAPQQITTVTVNGAPAPSCRDGDYLSFPCQAASQLVLSAPDQAFSTDNVTVAATLTSAATPLAGRAVRIRLGALTTSAATDARGVARFTFPLDVDPADFVLRADFDGDDAIAPSSASLPLSVRPDLTSLRYTGDTRGIGDQVLVSCVLNEDETAGLAGRLVRFDVGNHVAQAVTDAGGRASALLSVADHGGSLPVTVSYAGERRYQAAATASTIRWGVAT